MICRNLSVKNGHLFFAGQDTTALARQYGTPLYLMDEDLLRENCRTYYFAMQKHFNGRAMALYASKANSFRQIYKIMTEEGMGIDVVSSGEIYTAVQAGFDMSKAYFHSNNKTDADIAYAMECGVGHFVVDNEEEVHAIEREAAARGIRQAILLRITPGIDPHTYEAISTGKVDSKFGSAIETGQADAVTALTLRQAHIRLDGFHCHVGSQVFEEDVFERAAEVMLRFIAHIRDTLGYTAEMLDLGGGYGVRYVESDQEIDIGEKLGDVAQTVRAVCAELALPVPFLLFEPGRSIVADAGLTLYTCGTIKRIPGYKNYVSVDGGMTDNPRFALYGARYTCYVANRMEEACDFLCSVVGRCCESGDILQENVFLPSSVARGDVIAVCTTGAYNFSMASNYNRIPRPPIVMLRGGESYVAVRRESLADLCRNDL